VTLTDVARAKLNLALHVTARRSDGWHELDSIVAFADFGDVLTIEEAVFDKLDVSGPFAAVLPASENNLVMVAMIRLRALYAKHGVALPNFHITLEKRLPVAAGIGGGSADAAAIVRLLMKWARVDLPKAELHGLLQDLGADVPVCFLQRQCRMQGVGEHLSPLTRPVMGHVVLINPGKPCETPPVFKALGLAPGQAHKSGVDPDKPLYWRNDLTEAAANVVPEIRHVLDELALFPEIGTSRMSGSGATCFALAETAEIAASVARRLGAAHPKWWAVASRLTE
jgi:4-diphosphocytidyl-2-C-methyl-D-erythritol kinase